MTKKFKDKQQGCCLVFVCLFVCLFVYTVFLVYGYE